MAHQIEFIDFGTFCADEIREYYDLNPDLSILTYAGMLGLTGTELKAILMSDGSAIDKEEAATAEQMFREYPDPAQRYEDLHRDRLEEEKHQRLEEEGMYGTPYDPETDTEPTETRTEYCYRMGFDM